MTDDSRPVVVAFDGSDPARAAVRAAAGLFAARRLIIVSVWEPGLALAMAPIRDATAMTYTPPSAEEMAAVDRAQHEHAVEAAEEGVRIARELGATADASPVADEQDVAATVAGIAERCDACAIVIGSRGLGGLKARFFGSTSRELLQSSKRPVLVVKA